MSASPSPLAGVHGVPMVWPVGALCLAIANALDARFNPVAVHGEITGFSRAASGHCYFALKDAAGQLRCAMFRRAASLLEFAPRDGDQVEVRGRIALYEPRGELQLVVESLRRAGQGTLFEQFLQRKAKLEAEGLFDAARKRPPAALPRAVGLVTSPGAAALRDVAAAMARRAPHVPVVLAPAAVQGTGAPSELVAALQALYALRPPVDAILLVRGGGSIEDLWAFNDEQLARVIAQSPVPVVSGIGHETDFSIADFCADVRAPTPTAAAELVAAPRERLLESLGRLEAGLRQAVVSRIDQHAQRLDLAAERLSRPAASVDRRRSRLEHLEQRLKHLLQTAHQRMARRQEGLQAALAAAWLRYLAAHGERLERAALRLRLLDPAVLLQRGYAWLEDAQGHPLTRAADATPGATVHATLADGKLDLRVLASAAGGRPTRGTGFTS